MMMLVVMGAWYNSDIFIIRFLCTFNNTRSIMNGFSEGFIGDDVV